MKGFCFDAVVAASVVTLVLWTLFYSVLTCSWTPSDSFSRMSTSFFIIIHIGFFCVYSLFFSPPSLLRGADVEARVAFFADPQIEGDGKINKHGIAGYLEVLFNDIYHRAVVSGISRLHPTHAVTLGDLFSSESLSEEEFEWRKKRLDWSFAHVFGKIPTINVTGNHDIGYGSIMHMNYVKTIEQHFGPTNGLYHIGGHIFCNINGQALEGAPDPLKKKAWEQVDLCAKEAADTHEPIILVTHIPLYNPDGDKKGCDSFLVKWDALNKFIEEQTHLSVATSDRIMDTLHPVMIFVGHDHSGCQYNVGSDRKTPQYTVRSMMGDFEGNAQLLTIGRRDGGDNSIQYAVSSCSLGLKMVYYIYAGITVLVYIGFRLLWSFKGSQLTRLLKRNKQKTE